MAPKSVAVIGGGFGGIVACATLVENGMYPTCFEWTEKPGGTWCYRDYSQEGVPSIMRSTIINHSKEIGALSNFPPHKDHNNYMRHEEMYQYILEFATAKDVLKYIKCNSKVTEVKKADDYDESGRWMVTVQNTITGAEETDVYDACVVSVGHLNRPKMPTYSGQEKFKGKIMHTHTLKKVDDFKDKNVVVVGMGCSGMDAAVESSNVANQVYLSTTSGSHVINRVSKNGRPYDLLLMTRFNTYLLEKSYILSSWLLEGMIDRFFHHSLYTVPPKRRVLEKDPAFNDQLYSKILSGSIMQKRGIEYFTETGVQFEGETKPIEADVVILATGYTYDFPFLEKGVLQSKDGTIQLYKCMFPTNLHHPTLAFLGFILPWGPGFPIGEMQTRYIAHVFSNNWKLPSKDVMEKDVMDRYKTSIVRFGSDEKASIRMDIVPYMDDLASEIGVMPNFLKMFFTDPKLYFKLMFGPSFSYQYRLEGPHKWEGARDAIMTAEERILWPIRRTDEKPEELNFISRWLQVILLELLA